MKKTPIFGLLAVFLVSIAAAGVYGFELFGRGERRMLAGNSNDAMQEALEADDYEAYLAALEESDRQFIAGKVTEEVFSQRVAKHKEMAGRRAGMEERKTAVESAIRAEDYDAWLEAIEDSPMAEKLKEAVSEDNFDVFAEFHQAMEDEDFEKADELAQELGLENLGMRNENRKGRMENRMQGIASECRH